MANFVYKKAKQNILNGKIDFSTKTFRVLFTNNIYIADENSDEFVSQINSSSIVLRSSSVQGITNIDGTIDAQDLTITIPANTAFSSIVFYQVGTSDADSRLLFYVDSAEGLPFSGTLEETNIIVNWNNLPEKILSL